MSRYVVKVCVAFSVGGVVELLVTFISDAVSLPGRWGLLILAAGLAIGGAIKGASLRRGWRPTIGFSIACVLFGWLTPLAMIALQAARNDTDVFSQSILCFSIGVGVTGVLGSAISGLGSRMVLLGLAIFAPAGAIGGAVFASVVVLLIPNAAMGWDAGQFMVGGYIVGVLIANALSGALFAVALAYPTHRRKKLGLCLKCGYDLRGSIERCPECGEPFDSLSSQRVVGDESPLLPG